MSKKKPKTKAIKIISICILTLLIFIFCLTSIFFFTMKKYKLDNSKFINLNKTVTFYDINNEEISVESQNISTTKIENIPKNLINAFVSIEDKRFYSHKGVDYRALFRAFYNNIKSKSIKEGASTISQQLIKNTHLSNEKTLKRKLIEIKLARDLEKKYTKNQILEMYLNTIYFGESCFGITKASKYYFNKDPKDLSLNECAVLAGLVKAPSNYSPLSNEDKCEKRKNIVLKEMYNQNYISKDEYENNKNTKIKLNVCESIGKFNYLSLVKKELNAILEEKNIYLDNIKVYTNFNKQAQQNIEDKFNIATDKYNKSVILLDKESKILAYISSHKECNRQIGSCIKPILCYGPAVELNQIEEYSLFLDEKTNFNGYTPSNYGNNYLGYITAKDALAKSSNVVSLKVLQDIGIENAKNFIKKTDITLTNNDNSLCIGLGATEYGATLKELTSAYSIFTNEGYYKNAFCINTIKDEFGFDIYEKRNVAKKVFEKDTTFIINEMLKETVLSGTAKKLKGNAPLYAKTGTVGIDSGNSDAYTISYNNDYILGTHFFSKDNLMENNVTGGSLTCDLSKKIWDSIYENKERPKYFSAPPSVKKIKLDKISFNDEHIIEIADNLAPKKYVLEFYTKSKNNYNKFSSRFSQPQVKSPKISVNQKGICIELCLTKSQNVLIYKEKISNETLVFDTAKSNSNIYLDTNNLKKINTYILVPYYKIDGEKFFGKEKVVYAKTDERFFDNFWDEEKAILN